MGSFADLNLHPATQVIAEEVGRHGVQHVHLIRLESDGFFVEVVPGAPEFSGLIPNLLQQRVVLNDDCVLDVASLRCWRSVSVVAGCGHPARAKGDVEGGLRK